MSAASVEPLAHIGKIRFALLALSVVLVVDAIAARVGHGMVAAIQSPEFVMSGQFSLVLAAGVLMVSCLHAVLIPLAREVTSAIGSLCSGRANWLLHEEVYPAHRPYYVSIKDVVAKALELNNAILLEVVNERRAEVARERRLRQLVLTVCITVLVNALCAETLIWHFMAQVDVGNPLAVACLCALAFIGVFVIQIALLALKTVEQDDLIGRHEAGAWFKEPVEDMMPSRFSAARRAFTQ